MFDLLELVEKAGGRRGAAGLEMQRFAIAIA